jgi:hypothetical protein
VELYERITGNSFQPAPTKDINARVPRTLQAYLG